MDRTASTTGNAINSRKKEGQPLVRIKPRQISESAESTLSLVSSQTAILPVMQHVRQLLDTSTATNNLGSEFDLSPGSGAMHLLINMSTIVNTLRNLTIKAAQLPFRSDRIEDFQRLRLLYASASEMNASLLRAINRVRGAEPVHDIGDMDVEELTSVLSTEFMMHWLTRPTTDTYFSSLKSITPQLGPHYFERDERVMSNDSAAMNISFLQWHAYIWPHIAATITEAADQLANAESVSLREQNNDALPGSSWENINLS